MIKKVFVDCFRGGSLLASYEASAKAMLAGLPPEPDFKAFIDEAKVSLASDRLAAPPYEGVVFSVRTSWGGSSGSASIRSSGKRRRFWIM